MNTKEKLLFSALKLFCEKGFEATSTTSICTDAGFSSGALFVHFKTKNELLDTLYMNIKKEYFEAANLGFETCNDLFEIAEKSLFQGSEYYKNNPEKFIFMKRFLNSPHISRITREVVEKEMQAMSDLLDIGKKQGKVIDLENALIFHLIIGANYNLIEYSIEHNTEITREQIHIIIRMIKKEKIYY